MGPITTVFFEVIQGSNVVKIDEEKLRSLDELGELDEGRSTVEERIGAALQNMRRLVELEVALEAERQELSSEAATVI